MQSKAATVKEYLASLPADRRDGIEAVRAMILRNLDPQYEEGMSYGMIGYYVPHKVFPAGYHCDPRQPLSFAGLASQKNYMSLYLMGVYCGCDGGGMTPHARWFHEAWAKTGKKLDMGKACIRFKKIDDLPLDVIGEAIRRVPAKVYIEQYEKALGQLRAMKTTSSKTAKKPPKDEKAHAKATSSKKSTVAMPAKSTGIRKVATKKTAKKASTK